PSTYHVAMNGGASSGQCSVYARTPIAPAKIPAAAPARRTLVGASPRSTHAVSSRVGSESSVMLNGHVVQVLPKTRAVRSPGAARASARPANNATADTG